MHYRRRTRLYNDPFDAPKKVQVSITWDQITNAAYKLRFDQIGKHWDKVQPIIDLIKTSIASSDREYEPETKTWYISEAKIKPIKEICEQIPDFEVIFIEKPEQVKATAFHSKEADYAEFKRLVSFAHVTFEDTVDLHVATKIFRQAAMKLHPDRAPEMASTMSSLNEVWTRLKGSYFK
jgi:DnaJ-class molecular chaperone